MLVSDLLEIGIQQRKAYEEAQKKADQDKAAGKKN
jgi:GAF domain-containing protein